MKSVLITGGSSGIGYEMSRHFARAGYRLLWVALAEEELHQAKNQLLAEFPQANILSKALDLSQTTSAETVFTWTQEQGGVQVLINNAGFGTYGFLQDTSLEKEIQMIHLNVLAVYRLSRLFLEEMRKTDHGTIINISSIAAFQPVTRMNTYASTKAFVFHFSRGLQEELRLQKSKIRILTVCPAAIADTPFIKSGGMEGVKTFQGLAYTTAKEVARDVWKGFNSRETFVVSGFKMRVLYALRPFIPYALQQYLVRKESEREEP